MEEVAAAKRSELDRQYASCRANMQVGALSRAMAALERLPRADPTSEATIEALAMLHPMPDDLERVAMPEDAPECSDLESLTKFIRTQAYKKKTSAPGPSGWTFAMVCDLLGDDVCLKGLGALVLDIVNGKLSQMCKSMLTASVLLPEQKPRGGVRPIACGEVFYRLAASFVSKNIAGAARVILAPL